MMTLAAASAKAGFTGGSHQHRIDRHQRPNQLRNFLDVLDFEFSAASTQLRLLEVGDAHDTAVLPNPRVWVIRSDPSWIRPSVNRQQTVGDGSGNMHGPAV